MWYQKSQCVFFKKTVWIWRLIWILGRLNGALLLPELLTRMDIHSVKNLPACLSQTAEFSWLQLALLFFVVCERGKGQIKRVHLEDIWCLHISQLFCSPQYPIASFLFLCLSPTNFSHRHTFIHWYALQLFSLVIIYFSAVLSLSSL